MDYLRFGAGLPGHACAGHGDLCARGLEARACAYLKEWVKFADDGGGGGGGDEDKGDRSERQPTRAELEAMLRRACGEGSEKGSGDGQGSGASAPAAAA